MPTCTRLTYASATTSITADIRRDLEDILNEARIFNNNHLIRGVLYYGNNLFFQCIEGQNKDIDALFDKISNDKRHKNIKLLSYERIAKPMFHDWEMKFVLHETNVQAFFAQNQWEVFNPYALEGGLSIQFLEFLHAYEQPENILYEVLDTKQNFNANWYKYILIVVIFSLIILTGLYLTFPRNATEAMHLF